MNIDIDTWTGLTVSQVLTQCGTAFEEVMLVDEPPGKLRALEFVCHQAVPPRKVRLEIAYDTSLFSATRDWARALVLARTVTRVVDNGASSP
jgi:hypothetical protein